MAKASEISRARLEVQRKEFEDVRLGIAFQHQPNKQFWTTISFWSLPWRELEQHRVSSRTYVLQWFPFFADPPQAGGDSMRNTKKNVSIDSLPAFSRLSTLGVMSLTGKLQYVVGLAATDNAPDVTEVMAPCRWGGIVFNGTTVHTNGKNSLGFRRRKENGCEAKKHLQPATQTKFGVYKCCTQANTDHMR